MLAIIIFIALLIEVIKEICNGSSKDFWKQIANHSSKDLDERDAKLNKKTTYKLLRPSLMDNS